ncbi:MAG: hypothetical protein M3O06_01480 [Pseudomonadota bacterium]|nr:hypothetical protein [Pseudomonadota bacterium]
MAPPHGDIGARGALPPDLEHRIAELESGRQSGDDFDRASLLWLGVFGVLLPAALLCFGWWA